MAGRSGFSISATTGNPAQEVRLKGERCSPRSPLRVSLNDGKSEISKMHDSCNLNPEIRKSQIGRPSDFKFLFSALRSCDFEIVRFHNSPTSQNSNSIP